MSSTAAAEPCTIGHALGFDPPLLEEFKQLHMSHMSDFLRNYQVYVHCLALKGWQHMSLVDLAPYGVPMYAFHGLNPLHPHCTGASAVAGNATSADVQLGEGVAPVPAMSVPHPDWLVTLDSEAPLTPALLQSLFSAFNDIVTADVSHVLSSNAESGAGAAVDSILLALIEPGSTMTFARVSDGLALPPAHMR